MPPRAQSPQNPEQGEKKVTKDPLAKYHVKNKYDPYTLKYSMDEYITDSITEKYKFKQLHKYDNIKLLLSFIVCGIVLFGHFYPIPFPQNWNLLLGCAIAYFIINTFLTYYDEKVVRDTFIEFEFKENNQTIYAKFISKIELYSDKYKFEAHFTPKGQDGKLSKITNELYVGNFFDKTGRIDATAMDQFIASTLNKIKSQQGTTR